MKTIPISEIFLSIQGEGRHSNYPTTFIRSGLCDYKCDWCDSDHSVLPEFKDTWDKLNSFDIMDKVIELTDGVPSLITLTGGNPAMHDWSEFIDLAHSKGYTLDMETQGSLSRPWFSKMDWITFSPKPPSSKMTTNYDKLEKCFTFIDIEKTSLKVVAGCDSQEDFDFAIDIFKRHPNVPLKYLSTLNLTPGEPNRDSILDSTRTLIEKILDLKMLDIHVQPQIHTLYWGNDLGK
jgi:7-carboxy-7-deazaguanine synthase